nr:hypothetical protein [Tanacetum cinerariifolium]
MCAPNKPLCSSGGSVHDQLSCLSPKYQWFVAQSAEADEDRNGDQFFYNIQDPLSFYRGMWSIWNPVTSKIMHLPRLVLEDGDSTSIKECCLSLPPDDPSSILQLTRTDKSNFVFFLLNRRRERLTWTEISYTKQLRRTSGDGCLVDSLCCCNGKVYALNTDNHFYEFVIEIGIVVKDGGVVIELMLFAGGPEFPFDQANSLVSLHKLDMTNIEWEKLEGLKKWDITGKRPGELEEEVKNMFKSSEIWDQVEDLKDGNFYVDLGRDNSVTYSPTIASEFGGNIHIRSLRGNVIYSYNLSDRTISLSSMFPSLLLPTSHVSVWEWRYGIFCFTGVLKGFPGSNNDQTITITSYKI